MSLGIRTSWRSLETHGYSLIRRNVPTQHLCYRSYTQIACPVAHDRGLSRSPALTSALARHYATDEDASSTPTSVVDNDEATESTRRVSRPSLPKPSFIERLARIPLSTHGSQGSILVRPKMDYPNKRETKIHDYKMHKDLRAQEFHEAQRRITKTKLPDWRKLLETMMLATPLYLDGVVELYIPKDQSYLLLDQEREGSLWDIRSRVGGYMELEKRPREDGTMVCRIAGTRKSIDESITAAVNLTKKLKIILLSNGSETVLHDETSTRNRLEDGTIQGQDLADNRADLVLEPSPRTSLETRLTSVRSLRYDRLSQQPIVLRDQASEVPRPEVWTKESFEEYIYTLTHGVLPTSVASRIYPAGTTHAAEVTKQLHRVFSYPATKSAQTLGAFKIALNYMARRGPGFRPDTRALFVRAEKNGIEMDTAVFNILAGDCAHQRDLATFSSTINLMLRGGLEPNIRTWMLFLTLVQDEQVKRYIFQAMHARNLLSDHKHLAMVALNMAKYDAERAVREGWQLDSFLRSQAALYGPGWYRWSHGHYTLNRILETLLKHSKFDEAMEFLNELGPRPGFPNHVTLDLCLHHARVHNHMQFARSMLARFERCDIAATSQSIMHLFSMYWRKQWPHSIDALWQYSLLTLQTNYHIRIRIAGILRKGFANDWDQRLPNISDASSSPSSRAVLNEAGLFSLLLTSAKNLLEDPTVGAENRDSRALMTRMLDRAHDIRAEGWTPQGGGLALLLENAAEKDSRFHEGTKKGAVILEPMEVPREQSLPKQEALVADEVLVTRGETHGQEGEDVDLDGRDTEEI